MTKAKAPETKLLTPSGGLPTGNWPESELVSYTRTDLSAALVAAAYERAAQLFDDIAEHDQHGLEYSDLVGIPIANRADLERSVRDAELGAKDIRALATDDQRAALDALLASAIREAEESAAAVHDIQCQVAIADALEERTSVLLDICAHLMDNDTGSVAAIFMEHPAVEAAVYARLAAIAPEDHAIRARGESPAAPAAQEGET